MLEADGLHTTANIDTHHIGDKLVLDCHGGANGGTGPGMDIRHDPDLAALGKGLVDQILDLLTGGGFKVPGKDLGLIVKALDNNHGVNLQGLKKGRQAGRRPFSYVLG